ncbi:MAG: PAS domain S-box protein [Desulfobacterales bacterium]|nr:PAS domain S-box protein [Desulfobacterales bacterium]
MRKTDKEADSLKELTILNDTILESAGEGIIVYNTDFEILRWNKFMEDISGYSADEVIGKNSLKIFPHLEETGVHELFKKALDGETAVSEFRPFKSPKTGEEGYTKGTYSPLKDKDGKIIGVVALVHDVTERGRAEAALRESEARYRTLFEQANDAIFLSTEDDRIIDVNRRACEMLGYTREELLAMKVSNLQAPEVRGQNGSVIKSELTQDGAPFESMDIHRDGSRIPVEVSTSRFTGEGEGLALSIVRDITERKRTEEELLKEKAFSDAAIASLPGVFYVFDERGKFLRWNRNFEIVSGRSGDEIARMRPEEFFPPGERARFNRMTRDVFDNGWSSLEADFLSRDGRVAYLLTGARFEVGGALCLAGMGMDVTDRARAERERLKRKKLESVGLLAGGIAHDFNNLLTGVFGNIEMAKIYLPPGHESHEFLDSAGRSMESATHLTKQLLTFAKGGDPVKETLSIGEVITEMARFSLRGGNVKLQSDIAPDLWPVEADKGQLGQVIGNLVINAKQAMPAGGKITIVARNVEKAGKRRVKITMRDEGAGIASPHLDKIFDPYFSTREKGSGLGLASTHSIISRHNGDITVDSKPNQGATFTIHLPASEKTVKKAAAAAPEKARAARVCSARILAMDDEKTVREVIRAMLNKMGCNVSFAVDGLEAVSKYREAFRNRSAYDVVIMDLTIPGGMGGQEAAREILEIDPAAKMIVSSGYATDPIMANYEKYGFKGVVAKPYLFNNLQEAIRRVLKT